MEFSNHPSEVQGHTYSYMIQLLLTGASASSSSSRQDQLVGVQVRGFSRHPRVYESCRLSSMVYEELLQKQTDSHTTMQC